MVNYVTSYILQIYITLTVSVVLHTVYMQNNVLPLAFVVVLIFPLGGNAELVSLVSFELNYVFWCV